MSNSTEAAVDSKPDVAIGGSSIKLKIFVKHQHGDKTQFMIKPHMQMGRLFNSYANHLGVEVDSLRFLTDDGMRIGEHKTPEKLGLEDGDEILCMLEQEGGMWICEKKIIEILYQRNSCPTQINMSSDS